MQDLSRDLGLVPALGQCDGFELGVGLIAEADMRRASGLAHALRLASGLSPQRRFKGFDDLGLDAEDQRPGDLARIEL